MAYFPSIDLAHLAYVTGAAGITTFAANVLAKLIPLHAPGFSAQPKSQVSTTALNDPSTTNHLSNIIVIHLCGTFEDALPKRSTATVRKHLENPSIQVIEVTQRKALAALEKDQKPKTIFGLSAPDYVAGGYLYAVKQLKQLLGADSKITDAEFAEILKNYRVILTGFSQGGGIAPQVAEKFLKNFTLTGQHLSVVSINGAVHSTAAGSLLPGWISDCAAYFCACLSDFKKGSPFFKSNEQAIQYLKEQGCSIEFLHHHLDLFLLPSHSGKDKFSISPEEVFIAMLAAPMAAYLTAQDQSSIPYAACLITSLLALSLSNHIISPMAPGVGETLRKITQPTITE